MILVRAVAVCNDPDLFHRYQAFADDFIQVRHECFNFIFGDDNFNHKREIFKKTQHLE
jgi:hypothetical protein